MSLGTAVAYLKYKKKSDLNSLKLGMGSVCVVCCPMTPLQTELEQNVNSDL